MEVIRAQSIPRPEYPRPQFVRREWLNLNGEWEFAFDDSDSGCGEGWFDGRPLPQRIVVPFPYQSALSGIGDTGIHEVVWYARSFGVPEAWLGRDVLLHFGAVDYRTTVWVNGHEAGHNRGGHVPFSLDVSPYLREGENRLVLRVEDRQDPHQPRGKQSSSGVPHGIDYYCTTGIWQTVWLEPVPSPRIDELRITPVLPPHPLAPSPGEPHPRSPSPPEWRGGTGRRRRGGRLPSPLVGEGLGVRGVSDAFDLAVYMHAPSTGWTIEAEVLDGGKIVARARAETAGAVARLRIDVPNAKRWSPDSPHLYDLRVRLLMANEVLDEVVSYAGLRSVAVHDGRFVLNGEPTYLAMALDQGYWPESYLAAPSDEALRADVEWAKRFGFNGVRKHQKVEDPRWLYWCDRLGLLVWGEMPNARAWSSEAEEMLLAEWERAVERDYNHPCVVAWVPVNESMGFPELREQHPGQFAFLERIVAATRRLDPDRPVIDNDGWEHTDVTDICAIHDYAPAGATLRERYAEALCGGPLPARMWTGAHAIFARGARYRGQPVMLTEVGGFLLLPEFPPDQLDRLYRLYDSFKTAPELLAKYRDVMEGLADLPFVAGFCYTQLTDIEQEINGLLTYDRRPKVASEEIAALHRRLFAGRGRLIERLQTVGPVR